MTTAEFNSFIRFIHQLSKHLVGQWTVIEGNRDDTIILMRADDLVTLQCKQWPGAKIKIKYERMRDLDRAKPSIYNGDINVDDPYILISDKLSAINAADEVSRDLLPHINSLHARVVARIQQRNSEILARREKLKRLSSIILAVPDHYTFQGRVFCNERPVRIEGNVYLPDAVELKLSGLSVDVAEKVLQLIANK